MVCSLPTVYCHQRISNSNCIGAQGNFFTACRRSNPPFKKRLSITSSFIQLGVISSRIVPASSRRNFSQIDFFHIFLSRKRSLRPCHPSPSQSKQLAKV